MHRSFPHMAGFFVVFPPIQNFTHPSVMGYYESGVHRSFPHMDLTLIVVGSGDQKNAHNMTHLHTRFPFL